MIDSGESRGNLATWQNNGKSAARKYYAKNGVMFRNPPPVYMPQERRSYVDGWNAEMRLLWVLHSVSNTLSEVFER